MFWGKLEYAVLDGGYGVGVDIGEAGVFGVGADGGGVGGAGVVLAGVFAGTGRFVL